MKLFDDLIINGAKEGTSDLHISGNHPLVYRRNGIIHSEQAVRMTHREIDDLLREILTPFQMQTLKSRLSVDFAYTVQNVRIRVNVFSTVRGISLAIRLLPAKIPSIAMLNLHPSLEKIAELPTGLILLCGPTGCGKSTTAAAIIEEINRLRPAHIVTLEDPIEYRFVSKQAFVEQRELGAHVHSYRQGLLDVLREAPDVIVVGEIRDPEEIRLTLSAAESGHLVIASLHAGKAEEAIYRLCNSFPPEAQNEIRVQLASTISWIIIQQLIYMPKLKFRLPHLAILRGTQPVRSLIRENKLAQIENIMQSGKSDGMFTTERYMTEFLNVKDSFIHPQQSFRAATETLRDANHESPLISAGAIPEAMHTPSPAMAYSQPEGGQIPVRGIEPPDILGHDSQYVIEENESLEDVIAKIEKLDKKRMTLS